MAVAGHGGGGLHSVGSRPSVSPGPTRRSNPPRWRVRIRRSDRLHLSRYSVGEAALGRVCGVHVPQRRPSVPRLLWRLSPISISAVSLKPSCIMHHFWLRGGSGGGGGGWTGEQLQAFPPASGLPAARFCAHSRGVKSAPLRCWRRDSLSPLLLPLFPHLHAKPLPAICEMWKLCV